MSKCFQSLLASELEAFLTFKIGLGHSYKRKCYTLRSFDRYVAEHHRSGRRLDMGSLINGWLAEFPARKSITVAIDLTVIRDYLGHASITTTNRYVSTNLKMKTEALAAFWKRAGIATAASVPWKPTPTLLEFLRSL